LLSTFTGSSSTSGLTCTNPNDPTTCKSGDEKEYIPVTRRYPTNRIIFILISDVGTDVMTHLLVSHKEREHIPINLLRNQVKVSLDETLWARLKIAQNINEVVPFLPLEPRHVRQILQAKVQQLNIEHQGKSWLQLAVDDNVLYYLTTGGFITYRRIVGKAASTNTAAQNANAADPNAIVSETNSNGKAAIVDTTSTEVIKYFAKFGARSVIFGGRFPDRSNSFQ
jgi:hypothetical protein